MSRTHFATLVTFLFCLGFGTFAYKVFELDFPLEPNVETPIWNAEARVSFQGRRKATKVQLQIPTSSTHAVVMDERFISSGYGLTTSSEPPNRKAVWSIRKAEGTQVLYYRAVVHARESKSEGIPTSKVPSVEPSTLDDAALLSAQTLISKITSRSADTEGFVLELLRELKKKDADENVPVLLKGRIGDQGRVELAVELLSLAMIPARSVHGIRLAEHGRNAPILHWLEVYDGEKSSWMSYSLTSGAQNFENYLVWWRGSEPLASIKGKESVEVKVSVARSQEPELMTALVEGKAENPMLFEFSLFSLPIDAQLVYRLILMIPIGGLIVVLLRNVIGLSTFGTFMPVLIALSFRETQVLWGLALFVVIVGLGLSVRFYFERLKLLLVPRLAAGLIVVILVMGVLSILFHKLGIDRGLSVALFPMVILTMTIERMSIVWEERGPSTAFKQGAGSMISALLCYAVMTQQNLQHLMFVFPELLFVLLAITLLLGRYTGYRLFELKRFKALVEN